MATVQSEARLQRSLGEITRLLDKHRVLDALTHRQEGPRRDLLEHMQHRQNVAELQRHLRAMHAADIAYVLESLPLEDRRTVWEQVHVEMAAMVFMEVSNAIRRSLVDVTARERLMRLLAALDPEDLGYVSESLPEDVLEELSQALESADRSVFEDSIQYEDDAVGHYMARELVAVLDTSSVDEVLGDLRRRGELPPQTDRIFVTDARNVLRGSVPLQVLLLRDPSSSIVSAIGDDTISFGPHEDARDAVKAFERYDLVSAPVVDERGKLVGRLTVDAAMDLLRDESNLQALKNAGLSGDEDLFAAPWHSARNRWPWLGINLLTAFVASRVIGQFEGAIQQLASLAALMPIVASIGGNTGNQTMALVIRALAVDRLQAGNARRLMRKELAISLMNGTVWGLVSRDVVHERDAWVGDERCRHPQPDCGSSGRRCDSRQPSRIGPRPGARVQRAADVHHGCDGILLFPGAGDGVPRLNIEDHEARTTKKITKSDLCSSCPSRSLCSAWFVVPWLTGPRAQGPGPRAQDSGPRTVSLEA